MTLELPEFNDVLRDGVLDIISAIDIEGIPVGGILSKIIGLLWEGPDDSKAQWLKVKKYAEDLVKEEIDKERLEKLNFRLEGYRKIAIAYKNTSMESNQKGQHLTDLLNVLRLFHADFWDARDPQKMFPLFGTYGSLWIGALFDQAFLYKEIYKQNDPDELLHLKEFRDNVKEYISGAQSIYDRLYAWRFSKLEIKEWQDSEINLVGKQYNSTWTFTDKYDGYTRKQRNSEMYDPSFHGPWAKSLMEREMKDRIFNINNDYVKGLQETLAVAQLWQYLEPEGIRPLTHIVIDDEGPWGGDRDKAVDFEDRPKPGSHITHVSLRTEIFIEGLQLSYDGEPADWHGNTKLGMPVELALDDDEIIVEVSGKSSSLIDHIAFRTNKQRVIEGGSSQSGKPFSAKGRPGWKKTSLHAISGWTDGNRLTGLKLHWKHLADLPPYTPSYKKNDPLPLATNLYLKAQNGKYLSSLVEEYSGKAASKEYFPKLGEAPVALQFILPSDAKTLADHDAVQIRTTETKARDYNLLSRFTTVQTYYYLPGYGNKQLWSVLKMIPSDGPILTGEKIYLRNVAACNYLSVDDNGYIVSVWEPYAWEVALP